MFVFLPTESFSPTSHETSTEQSPVSSTKQVVTTTYKPTVLVSTTSEGETVPTVVYETTTTTQQETTPIITAETTPYSSEETTPVYFSTVTFGKTTEIPSHQTTVESTTKPIFVYTTTSYEHSEGKLKFYIYFYYLKTVLTTGWF